MMSKLTGHLEEIGVPAHYVGEVIDLEAEVARLQEHTKFLRGKIADKDVENARLQTALEILKGGIKAGLSNLGVPPSQHRVHEGEAIVALEGALEGARDAIDIPPDEAREKERG